MGQPRPACATRHSRDCGHTRTENNLIIGGYLRANMGQSESLSKTQRANPSLYIINQSGPPRTAQKPSKSDQNWAIRDQMCQNLQISKIGEFIKTEQCGQY